MAIFDENIEDDNEEQDPKARRRLFDIHAKECSIVDRAANKKKFLVIKRKEGFMPDAIDQVERKEDMEFGPDPGFENPIDSVLEKASDLVEDIHEQYPELFEKLDDEEEEEEEVDKQDFTIPTNVKEAVMQMLTGIVENASSLLKGVKDANTTEESSDKPLPAEVGKRVEKLKSELDTVTSKYPFPMEKAKLSLNGQQRIVKKLTNVLTNVSTVLTEIKDADIEKRDGKLPDELAQAVGNSYLILSNIIDRFTTFKRQSKEAQEVEEVEKAGRKISKKNLDILTRLRDEIANLIKGLEGEDTEETQDDVKKSEVKEEDKVEDAVVTADLISAAIAKQFEKVDASIQILAENVESQAKKISKFSKEPNAPNSRPNERTSFEKEDDLYWPGDMNRPLDRKNVPDNRYMG